MQLGGLPECELERLKQEAERLGKASFAFAFYMDHQIQERQRGLTIARTSKEFFTEKWRPTVIVGAKSGLELMSPSDGLCKRNQGNRLGST